MNATDDWPRMPDGSDFDGKELLTLLRSGNSPFRHDWDVNLLIREIEDNLHTHVIVIPLVSKGSNNYVSGLRCNPPTPMSPTLRLYFWVLANPERLLHWRWTRPSIYPPSWCASVS